jgi:hypothetical protein
MDGRGVFVSSIASFFLKNNYKNMHVSDLYARYDELLQHDSMRGCFSSPLVKLLVWSKKLQRQMYL